MRRSFRGGSVGAAAWECSPFSTAGHRDRNIQFKLFKSLGRVGKAGEQPALLDFEDCELPRNDAHFHAAGRRRTARRRCLSCRLQLPTASFIIEECGFEWGSGRRLALRSALRVVLHFRFSQADVIGDVRGQLEQNSFAAAETELRTYKARMGYSGVSRGAVVDGAGRGKAGQWDQAAGYATETRSLCGEATRQAQTGCEPHCRSRWRGLRSSGAGNGMRKESTPRR